MWGVGVFSNEIKGLTGFFGDHLNRPKAPKPSARGLAESCGGLLFQLITTGS